MTTKINVTAREQKAKGNQLRAMGIIPAVVYGNHFETKSIQISEKDMTQLVKSHEVGAKLVLDIDGEDQMVLLKDIQRAPLTGFVQHIDFHALTKGEKVRTNVPIHIHGRDSLEQDVVVQEVISEIEIEALPKDLIDYVELDLSNYKLGDTVTVSDLGFDKIEGVEVHAEPDADVVYLTEAKLQEIEEVNEEETEAAPEVPVIGDEEE